MSARSVPSDPGTGLIAVSFLSLSMTCQHLAQAEILNVPGEYPTIQDALWAAQDGDEIVVADGNYSGSGFRNINYGGLRVTVRSASGDPSLCTIDCQQSGRGFTFDNDETAESVLEGFTIAWGFAADDGVGGAIFVAGATPTIRNCIFSSCNALLDGGAVYVDGASPSFSDCTFESNTANHNGGGACINGGAPSFTNCAFDANQAFSHGGGLYDSNCTPVINGCDFVANSATVDGGGVYITQGSPSFADCTIRENSANDDGGGMYVYQATLAITACTFDANTGLDGGGGLCYISEHDCTISGSTFSDNEGKFGGGIYVARAGLEPTVTLEGCSFTGNTMPPEVTGYGGGVYVDLATLVANDCVFNGNGATDNGGAAFIEGAFTATNTDFIHNFANGAHGGGAIATDGADITLTDCLFDDNHALTTTEGGGAIRLLEGSLSATGCTFDSNSAPAAGGALCIFPNSEATLIDCTLADNFITLDNVELDGGGAIYIDSNGTINLNSCTLSQNIGVDHGGALYCQLDSNTLISDCAFIGNQALGTPADGGAIYAYGALFVTDSRFESNSGSAGGAVSGNGSFVNCEFVNNNCSGSGGAVFNQWGLYLYELAFVNCRFIRNQSQSGGGAVRAHVTNTQGTRIIGCEFIGNTTAHSGGAIDAQTYTQPLEVANCTFWANSALESGGGLQISSSQDGVASVYNSIVRGNSPDQINLIDSLEVSYCDIEDGWAGNGSHNIDADPLFIDPDGLDDIPGTEDDNLRLLPLSPCIDAADNTAVPADEFDLDEDGNTSEPIPFDLDGDDRFVDAPATEDTGNGTPPIVDMGAYEFQACPADFDHDDDVDTADLLHLLGAWGTADGDTDYDGDTDTADLLTLLGTWGACP